MWPSDQIISLDKTSVSYAAALTRDRGAAAASTRNFTLGPSRGSIKRRGRAYLMTGSLPCAALLTINGSSSSLGLTSCRIWPLLAQTFIGHELTNSNKLQSFTHVPILVTSLVGFII